MVKALHAAGIEVILDVVYNHTAEGNHLGPVLSFKGIDNAAYYRLVDGDRRFYYDTTGTGNSLNMRHPHVLQLIMDSLRYWVTEMHVDGFRFDLASTLARQFHEVDRLSAFFDLIQQDPVVSRVKLIAEPWDVGEGGYQVGNFPPLWSEWNGKYRDTLRDYWRGEPQTLGEFASRLTGSSDLYEDDGRRPSASVNFVTAHDGFTLNDLVSYNDKHNEANGEGGADGESHNRSWNSGAEGPTDDPEVLEIRGRQRRNFLATLLALAGHPDAARRRRDRPHAGRQQQRLLPGQRDLVVRLGARGRRPARVHAATDRLPARASGVPAPPLLPRRVARRGRPRHRVVPARRLRDEGRGLVVRLREGDRGVLERRDDPEPGRARRARGGRFLPGALQRPSRAARASRRPRRSGALAGCGCSTPRTPSTRARAWTPPPPRRWTREAWRCSAGRADMDLRVERQDGEGRPGGRGARRARPRRRSRAAPRADRSDRRAARTAAGRRPRGRRLHRLGRPRRAGRRAQARARTARATSCWWPPAGASSGCSS